MTTMLEKMARAHCERLAERSGEDYMRWDALGPSMQAWEIEATRAALLAIREPSAEVAEAGMIAGGFTGYADVAFTATIDAILNEKPEGEP